MFHPAWDKIYGDPTEPATSVVFGEKGAGKTAMRMQVVRRLADFNADHPEAQVFVVQYDDFNPFLDRFRERFHGRGRRIDRALAQWRLWDHIDAVLSLAVTQLVDRILEVRQARHPAAREEPLPIEKLDAAQVRDVALLAAIYDQSTAESPARALAAAPQKAAVFHLAVEVGPGPWRRHNCAGACALRLARLVADALDMDAGGGRRRLGAVHRAVPEIHLARLADRPAPRGSCTTPSIPCGRFS